MNIDDKVITKDGKCGTIKSYNETEDMYFVELSIGFGFGDYYKKEDLEDE